MTDENVLMVQVQEGQLDKLAILFERNHVPLFHYFIRTGNNRTASEDLVQETFIKVLAYRSSFSGTSTFKSWLFGIARNTKADYYRKHKRENEHADIDASDVKSGVSTSQEYELNNRQGLFDKALASLAVEQKEILVLSRFHNLNYQQIASMQDCNVNTLKSRMRKALDALKQSYDRLAGENNR